MLAPSPSTFLCWSLLQTVMTSVYGVTFIGAREQIASRLRERGFPWQDWAELCKLSTYAAQVRQVPWQSLCAVCPPVASREHTCDASCTPLAPAPKPSCLAQHVRAPACCHHAGPDWLARMWEVLFLLLPTLLNPFQALGR